MCYVRNNVQTKTLLEFEDEYETRNEYETCKPKLASTKCDNSSPMSKYIPSNVDEVCSDPKIVELLYRNSKIVQ